MTDLKEITGELHKQIYTTGVKVLWDLDQLLGEMGLDNYTLEVGYSDGKLNTTFTCLAKDLKNMVRGCGFTEFNPRRAEIKVILAP